MPGQVNKGEAAYNRELEQRLRAGEIIRHRFEPMENHILKRVGIRLREFRTVDASEVLRAITDKCV
jgi:predicted amidohydrolase